MKVVLFYHSILSCWNHGNVHFLRGIARALLRDGHEVVVYEPEDGWSRINALADGGAASLAEAARLIPGLSVRHYRDAAIDLDETTDRADLILVHEWNSPSLIEALGAHRIAGGRYTLLFHDTHHRAVTAPHELASLQLEGYDGILAFGEALRSAYLRHDWGRRVFTWHEAADTDLFRPLPDIDKTLDLVWIGNWGDDERSRELETFLIAPAERLRLQARIHGVRYPDAVRAMLAKRGMQHGGWLPNHRAPQAFATARVTVHIPRRPYTEALPGIPTIRVFEALACGIPLVSAPWDDLEGLFPFDAYLRVNDEAQMVGALRAVLHDAHFAGELAASGRRAIEARHTCRHRVTELYAILDGIKAAPSPAVLPQRAHEPEVTHA